MKIIVEHEVPDGVFCAVKKAWGYLDCPYLYDFDGTNCLLFNHSFYGLFPYRKIKACRDAARAS